MAGQPLPLRLERPLQTAAEVRLDRHALERLEVSGCRPGASAVGAARCERRLPVLERLVMPADRGGGPRGARSQPANGGGVAAETGVVDQASEPHATVRLEGGEHRALERAPAQRTELVEDGPAGELVAEGHGVPVEGQDLSAQARVDGLRRWCGGRRHQPELGRTGHDRGELGHLAGGLRQRGEPERDGFADAARDGVPG